VKPPIRTVRCPHCDGELAAYDHATRTAHLTISAPTWDALEERAHRALTALADGHGYLIDHITASPLVRTAGGDICMWTADIEARIIPNADD